MRTRSAAIAVIVVIVLIVVGVFAWRALNPGPMAFAGGSTVALADYHAADPTGVPASLSKAEAVERGEYLARAADCLVCHTAPGGKDLRRRPRHSAAVRDALFDEHYARQGDRDRRLQRPGFSQRGAARHPPRRRAALSGDAVYLLHLHDRRRRAGDQGLFVQPRPGQIRRAGGYVELPVQSALGDGDLVGGLQRKYALSPEHGAKRGVEPRRLYRRGAGALRRMPYTAQSRLRARQSEKIRRRDHGRLARLRHHVRQGLRRRRVERRRAVRLSVGRSCQRPRHRVGTNGRSGRSELQPDGAERISAPWSRICAASLRSPRRTCRQRLRRRRRLHPRRAAQQRTLSANAYSNRPAPAATTGPE